MLGRERLQHTHLQRGSSRARVRARARRQAGESDVARHSTPRPSPAQAGPARRGRAAAERATSPGDEELRPSGRRTDT
eukprot:scaffold133817_cov32-Tisochrysis_lutea.AAC.2